MANTFAAFLKKFPEVKLHVSITEDTASEFGKENEPLNERMILDNILPIEGETEIDEMTEYVACFRLAGLKDIHAVVYWKASLLNYEYVLVTFEKNGKPITGQVIAGTTSNGKTIIRSVAKIDEDFTIYIVSGQVEGSDENYDATNSTAREIELLPDGRLVEFA
jgi:hypothetical protein